MSRAQKLSSAPFGIMGSNAVIILLIDLLSALLSEYCSKSYAKILVHLFGCKTPCLLKGRLAQVSHGRQKRPRSSESAVRVTDQNGDLTKLSAAGYLRIESPENFTLPELIRQTAGIIAEG